MGLPRLLDTAQRCAEIDEHLGHPAAIAAVGLQHIDSCAQGFQFACTRGGGGAPADENQAAGPVLNHPAGQQKAERAGAAGDEVRGVRMERRRAGNGRKANRRDTRNQALAAAKRDLIFAIGLMNVIERADDPGIDCLTYMVKWSLKQDAASAEPAHAGCTCGGGGACS